MKSKSKTAKVVAATRNFITGLFAFIAGTAVAVATAPISTMLTFAFIVVAEIGIAFGSSALLKKLLNFAYKFTNPLMSPVIRNLENAVLSINELNAAPLLTRISLRAMSTVVNIITLPFMALVSVISGALIAFSLGAKVSMEIFNKVSAKEKVNSSNDEASSTNSFEEESVRQENDPHFGLATESPEPMLTRKLLADTNPSFEEIRSNAPVTDANAHRVEQSEEKRQKCCFS